MESLEEKIARVVKEQIDVLEYDPYWPKAFEDERRHLESVLLPGLLRRIEHCGSTSIPGIVANPIIDMLVEVADLERARVEIAPVLEAQGYDFFDRPTCDQEGDPTYLWFIKRDANGRRSHHVHMIDDSPEHAHHWDKLLFRDYLLDHAETASEYGDLKQQLVAHHHGDRVAYTRAKAEFIARVLTLAKKLE